MINTKEFMESDHVFWKGHEEFQKALQAYLAERDLSLPDDVRYGSGIDCAFVFAGKFPILRVGLPPVSNYPVLETEHTDKYLRVPEAIAV